MKYNYIIQDIVSRKVSPYIEAALDEVREGRTPYKIYDIFSEIITTAHITGETAGVNFDKLHPPFIEQKILEHAFSTIDRLFRGNKNRYNPTVDKEMERLFQDIFSAGYATRLEDIKGEDND